MAYMGNAELYCDECAPNGAEEIEIGETDAPDNCAMCGKRLDYTLTSDGIKYVMEKIEESLRESEESRNRIIPKLGTAEERMTWYHGSRHVQIVRDWAEDLLNYGLSKEDREIVENFLDATWE